MRDHHFGRLPFCCQSELDGKAGPPENIVIAAYRQKSLKCHLSTAKSAAQFCNFSFNCLLQKTQSHHHFDHSCFLSVDISKNLNEIFTLAVAITDVFPIV